jgi:cystathionine gamma-synthase
MTMDGRAHNGGGGPEWLAATIAVAGGRPQTPGAPLNVPIVPATSFRGDDDPGYSRAGNPTWEPFEQVVGALEGGTALAFASGMAAITAAFDCALTDAGRPRVVAVPKVCYSGTRTLLARWASSGRIRLLDYDGEVAESVVAAAEAADVVFIESPANPIMTITDIAATVELARTVGAITICDNTYATPLVTQPLSLGVDLVVHSASKYLAGHSDALLGVTVTGSERLAARLLDLRTDHGAVPGVLEAYLATRGLRTLPVRVARSQASAAELAVRLAAHPDVAWVRYPGLPEDPGHGVASAQMSGFGSVITFGPSAGAEAADRIPRATKLWLHATSLGGVESTLERRRRHVQESPATPAELIRLSVGCEDVEDLWSDLDRAICG